MAVYVLPDGDEIDDTSLGDVRAAAWPTYTRAKIQMLDSTAVKRVSLAGEPYVPGAVGLRVAIGHTDYANAVVQALARIGPLRDYFLLERAPGASIAGSISSRASASHTALARTFGDLVARMWSPDNFRSHVGPGPFLECVAAASNRQFGFGDRGADPAEFLAWLLRALRKGGRGLSAALDRCFKGKVRVTSRKLKKRDGDAAAPAPAEEATTTVSPFVMLSIDVPPAPLFKDAAKGSVIPQVPIYNCLAKFDGTTETYSAEGTVSRTYKIAELPQFLIIHLRRLTKNDFFVEKNPTIVTFPCDGLDLAEHADAQGGKAAYSDRK
jgi:U4/U6.U5 tri-snRNP-associated protein 2